MFSAALTTPALLVDKARLQNNLAAMQATADANDVRLRPHAKTHKSVALAREQQARGAEGLTVATVPEAETFVESGIDNVRVAMPVVGRDKHERLQALRGDARLSFTVDTAAGAEQADAVYPEDEPIDVLMEVDVGHGRCGVPWDQGETAVHRACRLAHADVPGVEPGSFEISIGSTPSMAAFENTERDGFRITEIRPGNYVMHDAMQVALGAASLDECALTVLTTVISTQRTADGSTRAFVDAGKKVFTTDTGYGTDGYGTVLGEAETMTPQPDLRLDHLSEEHGWLTVPPSAPLAVGDRLRIVPNHACVTIATKDHLHVVHDGDLVDTWPVA
jgi:D-serine deaminase-like pyridoxal phosphate-dependent protein